METDFEVLPLSESKSLILDALRTNQIFICISETGSGKTTQIPQFCLDNGFLGDKGMMAITQPRRVAAISVAQRVSEERNGRLGDDVGYAVRFDEKTSNRTRIKFMTDGILLRECLSDPSLSKYSVIMLDEAHERSINTDILFGLIKGACRQRSNLKVIVTSATLNIDKFSDYFNNCSVIRIPGRMFPVDIYHSKTKQIMTASGPASNAYLTAAVDCILNIHRSDEEGHILVFLTGQEEVEKACALVRAASREDDLEQLTARKLVVLPLYAALSNEQQKLIFQKLDNISSAATGTDRASGDRVIKPPRKCIIATNIAETSITVPNVRFVVDAGYVKQKTFEPTRAMESLIVVPISQVSSNQRAGRAGRTASGSCYRLYSSDCYDDMMAETIPEILRSNLSSTVLYLKALGVMDVLTFDFIEPPAADQVAEALASLYTLGCIDQSGLITDIGRAVSRLPLEPTVGRMVVAAATRDIDCLPSAVIIASMLSTEPVFIRPMRAVAGSGAASTGRQREMSAVDPNAELAHARLSHSMGDHHTYLRIFNQFCAAGKSTGHDDEREQIRWCRDNFLNFRSLRSAVRIREQLWDEVKNLREMTANGSNSNGNRDNKITSKSTSSSSLSISSSGHAEDIRLMNAILTGLYPHAARLCAGNDVVYRSLPFSSLKGEEPVDVMLLHTNASSALSLGAHRPPEYVVYQDLVFGGRATIRHVCAVEYSALQKIRSMFSAVHLDQLRGLPMPEPKPKITTTTADTKINDNKRKLELSMTSDSTTRAAERSSYSCTSQTIISENQSSVSVVAGQSVNTIDRTQAARERFLARQRTS